MKTKTPPADSTGSQPDVNHILRVKVDLPKAVNPAAWQHKAIRLSLQTSEGVYTGKLSRKKKKSEYESSSFSANGHIVGEYFCGDIKITINLYEALRERNTALLSELPDCNVCFLLNPSNCIIWCVFFLG